MPSWVKRRASVNKIESVTQNAECRKVKMEGDVQEKSATEASNSCVIVLLVYRNHWQTLGSLGWNIAGMSGRVSPWAEDTTMLWWRVQSAHSLPSFSSYPLFTSFTLCLLITSRRFQHFCSLCTLSSSGWAPRLLLLPLPWRLLSPPHWAPHRYV